MFPRTHGEAVPTVVSATASASALFATGVARPSGDNVSVVESHSTRTLKVLNQKDNQEFYFLVKEIVLFKPAQIAEMAQSKQRT